MGNRLRSPIELYLRFRLFVLAAEHTQRQIGGRRKMTVIRVVVSCGVKANGGGGGLMASSETQRRASSDVWGGLSKHLMV